MNLSDRISRWRIKLVFWSPMLVITLVFVALGNAVLPFAVFAFFCQFLGGFAYMLICSGLIFLSGESDGDSVGSEYGHQQSNKILDAAARHTFNSTGAAGVILAALVWGWMIHKQHKTEAYVTTCVETYTYRIGQRDRYLYEFENSVADVVRSCFEEEGAPIDDYD